MPDVPDVLRTVLTAVATVLDKPQVAPGDNFFDLGGDSLAALAVVSHIEEALGREIPLDAIFDVDDLTALAALIADLPADQPAG